MEAVIAKYPAYVPLEQLPGYDISMKAFLREMAELQILLIQ